MAFQDQNINQDLKHCLEARVSARMREYEDRLANLWLEKKMLEATGIDIPHENQCRLKKIHADIGLYRRYITQQRKILRLK